MTGCCVSIFGSNIQQLLGNSHKSLSLYLSKRSQVLTAHLCNFVCDTGLDTDRHFTFNK